MRSLQVQNHDWDHDDAHARAPAPSPVTAAAPPAYEPWVPGARWSDRQAQVNWPCAGAAIAFSSLFLAALMAANVVPVPFVKRGPTVVKLIEVPPDPPEITAPPEAKVEPVREIKPVIVAPKAIVQTPSLAPPPIQTVSTPPPVAVAVVSPEPAKSGPAGPLSITDLSTSLRSGKPPKYPVESRRRREEGTVVVSLVVSIAGRVTQASVMRSSGFPRLDDAALDAVRQFVYKPYTLNGEPVSVRTTVTFPFRVQG